MPIVVPPSGPGPTLLTLAREVSKRNGDYAQSTPTAGTATSLVDQTLLQTFPQSSGFAYAYAYSVQTNTDGNAGLERRASNWSAANWTLTFSAPGFPNAVGAINQTYEIRFKDSRERVVEAINSGIGQLALACLRDVKDETLLGVQNQWRYALPGTQYWASIDDVEIQTNTTYADFPYSKANDMGVIWRAERTVDAAGNETWQLQFSSQPPAGYIIRVWGQAFYPDLSNDADILALGGKWRRIVLEWIYEWAQAKIAEWNWSAFATGEAKQAHERKVEHLQEAKTSILEQLKADVPGRIITPNNQMRGPSWNDPAYLGAYSSGGISHSPFNPVP